MNTDAGWAPRDDLDILDKKKISHAHSEWTLHHPAHSLFTTQTELLQLPLSDFSNSVCSGIGAETHKLCQLLCEQQTCELTGASNSSRLKVMYAGVSSDVMQVSRAFSAAASCGCCDGFKRLLTAGSGERTVYSTSDSWLQATEKNNF